MAERDPDKAPAGSGTDEDAFVKLEVESIISDLDTAHEELRVAEEEIRAQREEIDRLLGYHRGHEWWQERLVANLPVPVVVTGTDGRVKSANAAVSSLLGLGQVRLLGKPIQTFVAADDRKSVRQALSQVVAGVETTSVSCHVQPRHVGARQVRAVISRAPDAADHELRLSWVLLPAPEALPEAGHARGVATAFARLAVLGQRADHAGYLADVAGIFGAALTPVAAVSVVVGRPSAPRVVGSDGQLAQRMDALQMRVDAGPCQTAWDTGQVVVSPKLADDRRWPDLAELAAGEEITSVLAVPVFIDDEPVGVLNGYATEQDAFADLDIETAEMLASAVGAVINQVTERDRLTQTSHQMEEALRSRAVIDQAKGIIVARYGCDPEQAFQRLVRVSRNSNVKLREVARLLVDQAQSRRGGGSAVSPPEDP